MHHEVVYWNYITVITAHKIKHFDYVMLNRTTSLHVFQGENAIIIFLINTYGIFIDCFRSCPISPLPIHFYKSFKIIIQLSR